MNLRRIKDLTERVILTFVGAFITIYLYAFSQGQADLAFLRDPGLFEKAQQAGITALFPLIAGLVGFRVGDKSTASIIPSNKPDVGPEEPIAVEYTEPVVEAGPADIPDIATQFPYWYKEEGA